MRGTADKIRRTAAYGEWLKERLEELKLSQAELAGQVKKVKRRSAAMSTGKRILMQKRRKRSRKYCRSTRRINRYLQKSFRR